MWILSCNRSVFCRRLCSAVLLRQLFVDGKGIYRRSGRPMCQSASAYLGSSSSFLQWITGSERRNIASMVAVSDVSREAVTAIAAVWFVSWILAKFHCLTACDLDPPWWGCTLHSAGVGAACLGRYDLLNCALCLIFMEALCYRSCRTLQTFLVLQKLAGGAIWLSISGSAVSFVTGSNETLL